MSVLETVALTDIDLSIAARATVRLTNPEVLAKMYERLRRDYNGSLADAIKQNEHAHKGIRAAAALLTPKSKES